MAPARSLSPGYHTTGADLCTTGSKKHELNLSKARSAGAISMSLLVPLLEFNQQRFSSAEIDSAHALVESGALGKVVVKF